MTNEEKAAFFAMLDKYNMNPMIIPSCSTLPRDRFIEENPELVLPISKEQNLED